MKKYPRTIHFPSSPGKSLDDIVDSPIWNLDSIVLVTEKMDGENTTISKEKCYARSIDSSDHPSRHYIKQLSANIQPYIGNYVVHGENCFAKHSIQYDNLKDYFLVFGVSYNWEYFLSWDDTEIFCEDLGLEMVNKIYVGNYYNEIEMDLFKKLNNSEGLVVRSVDSFKWEDFDKNVRKYVRENHVQTNEHWMNSKLIKNTLERR